MAISTGVSKVKEWKGSSIWYKVNCACGGGEDCDSLIDLSFDKDFGHIDVEFYKNIVWADYYKNDWFWQRWWSRIKAASKVLFTGYIEMEGGFLIEGEEHLDGFIEALQEGKGKIKQWQKEFNDENKKWICE